MVAASSAGAAPGGVPGAADDMSRLHLEQADPAVPTVSTFPTEIQKQILRYVEWPTLISLRATGRNYRDIITNDCQDIWKDAYDDRWKYGKRKASVEFQAWSITKGWKVHSEDLDGGNWYNEFARRSRLDQAVRGRLMTLDVAQSENNDVWYGLMEDGQDIVDALKKIAIEQRKLSEEFNLPAAHRDIAALLNASEKVLAGIIRCSAYQEWKFLLDVVSGGFNGGKVHLEDGAITIAKFYSTARDVVRCRQNWIDITEGEVNMKLDELANFVKERLDERCGPVPNYPILDVLEEMKLLFQRSQPLPGVNPPMGFIGNVDDYYSQFNSLINYSLSTRTGIPMTLSIIYISIVRRVCGVEMDIIGLPGHIVVGAPSDGVSNASRIFVDPFNQGKILNFADCQNIVARYNITFTEDMVKPISHVQVWERIMRNLIHCHSMQALADDSSEYSDSSHEWRIALPLRSWLLEYASQVTNFETLLKVPGWCPQYC